ncbi:LEAF RUST 10 DISEASE-RESISTANCE LOCUS RECEPTOR-LIKE PROTEIN KINASE-like 1.3 [Eucalyptus grandis]|uniref:LEAF RUST 10 DISEASE-RESISTANCE LOCUS RECEPTOR-LIKE PROTEIN KINASE-like 1.3 n=1 Tax=Eucalyptus grandis TaxID=71139 RepID=UPI00192EF8AB|nr:LEAF RUST 10 DISEASE-RESISTANCE LOCUS RECEPTOR-LIKE PROTEIN KINASE-like 1.3 [Eucalyptus grandis]
MPNHHLLRILSPCLSLFLLFFFGSFHGVLSTFSTIYGNVSSSSQCGDIFIKYPFWTVSNAAVHHGYPGLGLSCSFGSNYPTLSLTNHTYFVTKINYINETLTLVDIDAADQRCPRARHNLTIGSLPFNYNSANVNLTFFFNCDAPPSVSSPSLDITCLQSGDKWSYVFTNMSQEEEAAFDEACHCEETVVAVVKRTEVTVGNVTEEFAAAMHAGFMLDWEAPKECNACELSGGRCAFNRNEQVMCFCDDESIHNDGSSCKGRDEICSNICDTTC